MTKKFSHAIFIVDAMEKALRRTKFTNKKRKQAFAAICALQEHTCWIVGLSAEISWSFYGMVERLYFQWKKGMIRRDICVLVYITGMITIWKESDICNANFLSFNEQSVWIMVNYIHRKTWEITLTQFRAHLTPFGNKTSPFWRDSYLHAPIKFLLLLWKMLSVSNRQKRRQ